MICVFPNTSFEIVKMFYSHIRGMEIANLSIRDLINGHFLTTEVITIQMNEFLLHQQVPESVSINCLFEMEVSSACLMRPA
jgi:hypothetical protein